MKCNVCGKTGIPIKIDIIAKRVWENEEKSEFVEWSTSMCPECYHKFLDWTEGKKLK